MRSTTNKSTPWSPAKCSTAADPTSHAVERKPPLLFAVYAAVLGVNRFPQLARSTPHLYRLDLGHHGGALLYPTNAVRPGDGRHRRNVVRPVPDVGRLSQSRLQWRVADEPADCSRGAPHLGAGAPSPSARVAVERGPDRNRGSPQAASRNRRRATRAVCAESVVPSDARPAAW